MNIRFCFNCFSQFDESTKHIYTLNIDSYEDVGYEAYVYKCELWGCHCIGALEFDKKFTRPRREVVPPVSFEDPVDTYVMVDYILKKLEDENSNKD